MRGRRAAARSAAWAALLVALAGCSGHGSRVVPAHLYQDPRLTAVPSPRPPAAPESGPAQADTTPRADTTKGLSESTAGPEPDPLTVPAATFATAAGAPAQSIGAAAPAPPVTQPLGEPTVRELAIGPGDLLQVSVLRVKELERVEVRVPPRGTISLPLVGTVQAAGRTPTQLQDLLRQWLMQDYVHDPRVSVLVLEYRGAGVEAPQRREPQQLERPATSGKDLPQ
jgi:hypothetical protein